MRTIERTIEIPDDIWKYLESRPRPFGDTAIDVLRRELGLGSVTKATAAAKNNAQDAPTARVNRRARGDESRGKYIAFLEREMSIQLKHETGSVYVLPCGKHVAFSTAIEKQPRGGGWFLGSPAALYEGEKMTALVLLCAKNDKQLDFVFSPSEMSKLAQILPKVAGQLKFNVVMRSEGHYDLLVSHKSPIDISSRLSDTAALQAAEHVKNISDSMGKTRDLYQQLIDTQFACIQRGEHELQEVYAVIKKTLPDLCDDGFICADVCREGNHYPEWQHKVRAALGHSDRVRHSAHGRWLFS